MVITLNGFKKFFSKKEKKDTQQPQPVPRGQLDTTQPNKIVEKGKISGEKRNLVWIEQLTCPTAIKANEKFEVIAQGNFPDLAWEFAEVTTTIQEREIIVTVIGKRRVDMMAGQALKPFEVSVNIEGLKRGIYTLKPAKGNAKEITINIT